MWVLKEAAKPPRHNAACVDIVIIVIIVNEDNIWDWEESIKDKDKIKYDFEGRATINRTPLESIAPSLHKNCRLRRQFLFRYPPSVERAPQWGAVALQRPAHDNLFLNVLASPR
jgi:hypothetical protein